MYFNQKELETTQTKRGVTTVFVLRGAAMAMAARQKFLVYTHTNIQTMIMTDYDNYDYDVGSHDHNITYIEHKKLFISVYTFSLVLSLSAMMSLNYMKQTTKNHPKPASFSKV